MKRTKICSSVRYLLFWLLMLSPLLLAAQDNMPSRPAAQNNVPSRPSPAKLVNNLSKEFPQFLTASEEAALESKLETFARETSNQLVVVIVDDFGGTDANSFTTELIRSWGVGQAKQDNGVAIVVKPTGPADQRDVYIGVGYGLEGAIPDITAKHIIENEITPAFRKGDYYGGLDAATDVIMKLAKGEYNAKQYDSTHREKRAGWIIAIIIFVIVFMVMRLRRGGRGGGFTIGHGGWYGGGWGRGGWGGGSWGGGGGGFGGFGGGSSGGGGAGGKW